MKEKIKKILISIGLRIIGFYFRHKTEFKMALFTTVVWSYSPFFIALLPQFPYSYENDSLQLFVRAMCGVSYFVSFVHFLMHYHWSSVDAYLAISYTKDFNSLTQWQKILISTGIFFFLLLSLVLIKT